MMSSSTKPRKKERIKVILEGGKFKLCYSVINHHKTKLTSAQPKLVPLAF